jgi:membrane associated rhomboid family serine protease
LFRSVYKKDCDRNTKKYKEHDMMSFGPAGISRSIKFILIASFSVFLLELLPWTGHFLLAWGSLIPVPAFFQGQIWRFFTYIFFHDPSIASLHIFINMLMLWMFGVEIEEIWGSRRFITFYLICGAGAGLFSFFSLFNPVAAITPVIGASGAVLGIMTIYAYYFPNRQIYLFFLIPVNIRIVVLGYALFSLTGAISSHGIISHITHLGGIVVALVYIKLYPYINSWISSGVQVITEHQNRKKYAHNLERSRFFEKNVDPILEKISQHGMESLTKQEKKILRSAAKNDKERLKRKRIIPFDPFR